MADMLVRLYDLPADAALAVPRPRTASVRGVGTDTGREDAVRVGGASAAGPADTPAGENRSECAGEAGRGASARAGDAARQAASDLCGAAGGGASREDAPPAGDEASSGGASAGDDEVVIRRAMAPDKFRVVEWVRAHTGPSAAGECDVAFSHQPISCFIATKGADIVGFACYDATAPDFFGPTKVLESEQGQGIGRALLLRSLAAMAAEGYAYAIIGGVGPATFYQETVGAMLIPDSTPGLYRDFLGGMRRERKD